MISSPVSVWAFEIFTEHIPSLMQKAAAEQLECMLLESHLKENRKFTYCTSRRLVCVVENVPNKFAHTIQEIKGPKIDCTQHILDKFCNAQAIKYNYPDIQQHLMQKNNYYYIKQFDIQEDAHSYLSNLSNQILVNFAWSKSMYWDESTKFKWIRPIRNILNLLDDQVIENKFFPATNFTYNEEYKQIDIMHAEQYIDTLDIEQIVLSLDKRLLILQEFLHSVNLQYHANEKLLEEIACSTETVCPFVCSLDHTQLTQELNNHFITTCVQEHQQAVVIYHPTKRNKYNQALIVQFMLCAKKNATPAMIADCQNVLLARLKDMVFLFEQDQKDNIACWASKMQTIPLYKDLGTLQDKIHRVKQIIADMKCNQSNLQQACDVYKLDLASKIVNEFPILHGDHINNFIQDETIQRIIQQYRKLNHDHTYNVEGLILGLFDRLDTLIQFFTLNLNINSSSDPLGLKKLGAEIIEYGLALNKLIKLESIDTLIHKYQTLTPIQTEQLLDFLKDRMLFALEALHENRKGKSICTISDFWNSWSKTQDYITNDAKELLEHTYMRVCNFIKKYEILSTLEQTDEKTIFIQNFIKHEQPSLQQIILFSQELQDFFENNMVLEEDKKDYRIYLLQQVKNTLEAWGL